MHLVDHARVHIEETYRAAVAGARHARAAGERAALSGAVPRRARHGMARRADGDDRLMDAVAGGSRQAARKAVPVAAGWLGVLRRMVAMLRLLPARLPGRSA